MPPKFDPNEVKVSKFKHAVETYCSLSNYSVCRAGCILAH